MPEHFERIWVEWLSAQGTTFTSPCLRNRYQARSQSRYFRLKQIVNGPEYMSLTQGNAKEAKDLKKRCAAIFAKIETAYRQDNDEADGGDRGKPKTEPKSKSKKP